MYAYALVNGAVSAPVERESSGGQQLIKHITTDKVADPGWNFF
jgi:hypothetical protein